MVRVKCKDGCEWNGYNAKMPSEDSWQLRKEVNIHICSRDYNGKMITIKCLRKRIQNSLKSNPKMKIRDIKENAQSKWNVVVNKTKEIKIRCVARDIVYGSLI